MTTLQELLNLGLMDIGSEDSRFTKMEAAGESLVNKLKTEPALIITAARYLCSAGRIFSSISVNQTF